MTISVIIVFLISLFMCCAIAYILGLFWFSDKRNRRLLSFFLLGIEIFIWTLLNAIVMVINTEFFPIVYTLRMVLVCIVPFGVSWFILDFVKSPLHEKVWMRNIFIILPLIDIAFMVTNPLHYLYFLDYSFPAPERAPIFWVHTSMDMGLIIIIFIVLLRFIIRGARKNPLLILTGVGMLIPYTMNMMYSFGYRPFPHDVTPLGFFFTFFLFMFVAYRLQLFNIKIALFSSTMDSIDDLIIICNEKYTITDVNKSASEVFSGFPLTVGHTKTDAFFDFLGGITSEKKPDNLIYMMKNREDIDGECTMSLPGGYYQTYTVMWRTIYNNRKKKTGNILIFANVSNYREMISEINKQNIELLDLKVKAEAASKAKSDFLANMSHEIRTPMNAITGMTAIAKTSTDPEKIKDALEKINGASVHLLGILNNILDMSKIEADKLELSPVMFDLNELLEKIVNINHFQMSDKQHDFTMKIDESIPKYIICDDQRLAQVLTNLLSNAIKFTHAHGKISLEAFLLCEKDGVYKIQFDVTDNGIGISKEQHSNLFISFSQAESGTMRKFGGTGLGLSISKRIVEMMGGEIWITSEKDEGSVFSFTINARGSDHADESIISPAGAELPGEGGAEKYSFAGYRILLVEDVEINREIVISLLESTEVEIDCAYNGREAFHMFCENPERYDLILMDIQMPEMDGYKATQLIRSLAITEAAEIPIIAMTANVFREDVKKSMEAGMNGHLGKPLDLDEMLNTLRKFLITT